MREDRVEGSSKSQTDIRRLFTTDTWIRTQFSVCGTSDGQSGMGTSFQQVLRFFRVTTIPPVFRAHFHSTIHRQYMTVTSNVVK
jgi:hypothetical protein